MPLICRRGHITRNEIGAIRVGQQETWFQIPRAIAAKFSDTVARTATQDDDQDAIVIEESSDGPRIEARDNRKKSRGAPVHAKPRGNPGGKGYGKGSGKPWKEKQRDPFNPDAKGGKPGGKTSPKKGKKFAGKRKPKS